MLKKSIRRSAGASAVSATMTSAKLKGVRCAATEGGGVPRLVAVGMGVTVAAETSAAQEPESADSRRALRTG
jgi:hypothetical protein